MGCVKTVNRVEKPDLCPLYLGNNDIPPQACCYYKLLEIARNSRNSRNHIQATMIDKPFPRRPDETGGNLFLNLEYTVNYLLKVIVVICIVICIVIVIVIVTSIIMIIQLG